MRAGERPLFALGLDNSYILIDNSEHPFRSKTALHVSTALDVYPANVPTVGVTLANSVDQQLDRLAPNVGFRAVEKPTPRQIPVFAVATQHPDRLAFGVVTQLDVSGVEFAAKDQSHAGGRILCLYTVYKSPGLCKSSTLLSQLGDLSEKAHEMSNRFMLKTEPEYFTRGPSPDRIAAPMEPSNDTQLAIAQDLDKSLSMAAVANRRTIEAEIIDRLSRTLDRDETEHCRRLDSGQDVL